MGRKLRDISQADFDAAVQRNGFIPHGFLSWRHGEHIYHVTDGLKREDQLDQLIKSRDSRQLRIERNQTAHYETFVEDVNGYQIYRDVETPELCHCFSEEEGWFGFDLTLENARLVCAALAPRVQETK